MYTYVYVNIYYICMCVYIYIYISLSLSRSLSLSLSVGLAGQCGLSSCGFGMKSGPTYSKYQTIKSPKPQRDDLMHGYARMQWGRLCSFVALAPED